jgi:hypothetical protein
MAETLLLGTVTAAMLLQLMNAVQVAFQQMQKQHEEMLENQRKMAEEQVKLKLTPLKAEVLNATGEEDTVVEYSDAEPFTLVGWVNLKNMASGDTVVIKESHFLAKDTDYTLYATRTYKDAQSQPLLRITPTQALKGCKVTLQQTSGTLKSYPYEFYISKGVG